MVYQYKVRMEQDSTFGAFDCPDSGQVCPKRSRSTTALQSLNLLNSPFVVQQAELFAERLRREAGQDVVAQVGLAFQLAFSREPEPDEEEASIRLIRGEGLEAHCRALFNTNEFLFLN